MLALVVDDTPFDKNRLLPVELFVGLGCLDKLTSVRSPAREQPAVVSTADRNRGQAEGFDLQVKTAKKYGVSRYMVTQHKQSICDSTYTSA